ncbi:MAG: endonuclease III [Hyphomicrobiales bacterium]
MAPRKLAERAKAIREILNSIYPQVKPQLLYRNPFELLVATILSAQCTDQQVNRVTPVLFKRMRDPQDFVRTPVAEIERLVRPTGFYRNKARNIKACCQALVEKHGGRVPRTLEDLVQLPGVGRKTANVVLGAAFGTPGIVVDTHVGRIAGRLALTRHRDPKRIELDLMRLIPRNEWSDFSLRLIFFGRETCTARKPRCPVCPIEQLCPYPDKTPKIAS